MSCRSTSNKIPMSGVIDINVRIYKAEFSIHLFKVLRAVHFKGTVQEIPVQKKT